MYIGCKGGCGMLKKELDRIIEERRLTTRFQPIINMKAGEIIGYEANIRGPVGSSLHSPISLFEVAERCGRFVELELLSREINIRNFARLGLPGKLFLNVSPSIVMETDFPKGFTKRFLSGLNLSPSQVVIELTEHTPIDDYHLFKDALSYYREMGFAVAIDDLGAGYSGLRLWSELDPEFVKLDRHFIQRIHEDYKKRQFVRSLLEIAMGQGCQTIAEGIETVDEYRTVRGLGITYGQGYLFGRPEPSPARELDFNFHLSENLSGGRYYASRNSVQVGCLLESVPTVSSDATFNEVWEAFSNNRNLRTLPVVDSGIPVGVLLKDDCMHMIASPYGRDLYGKESISALMGKATLVIEKSTPVEKISQILGGQDSVYRGEDLILVEDGFYVGIATIMGLLRKVTELQVRHAQHSNPLTQLPGNVPINEHLERLIGEGWPFTACYFDLDNFKPYNDINGYGRGDMVISLLSGILVDMTDSEFDFVGHIGGDDFMVVFQSFDWEERCNKILRRFADEIPTYYKEGDREKGGIWAETRTGDKAFYPFVSLSIGAVHFEGGDGITCHDVAAVASEAKSVAKKQPGNSIFVDRRKAGKAPKREEIFPMRGAMYGKGASSASIETFSGNI